MGSAGASVSGSGGGAAAEISWAGVLGGSARAGPPGMHRLARRLMLPRSLADAERWGDGVMGRPKDRLLTPSPRSPGVPFTTSVASNYPNTVSAANSGDQRHLDRLNLRQPLDDRSPVRAAISG